jgi:hypothetical protein
MGIYGNGSTSGAAANAGAAPGAGQGGGQKKKKFHPLKILADLQTDQALNGKDLRQAARALTMLEVRPQVKGYALLAKQLHNERETEAKGLGALGSHLQGNVKDVYHNIAASEAQNLANQQALASGLNVQSAQIAQQGQQNLTDMQKGQLGDLTAGLAIRGAPGGGSAQQELANAVAQQQAGQSANSQAAQQFAAQQGAGYGQLAAAMAGSAQMQGGASVGAIGRDVTNRIAESNMKYGQSIQDARQKLAEAKASKGATFVKNLLGLREGEQKFLLGKQAVVSEKEKLRLAEKENAEDRRQKELENEQWEKEFGLDTWKAHHPNAGSNETKKKREELHQDIGEIKSVIPTAVAASKGTGAANNFEAYVAYVNTKTSAPPQLVRKVLQHWWRERGYDPGKDAAPAGR